MAVRRRVEPFRTPTLVAPQRTLRSCPSSHPIGGANSQLQFWQSFPPSFGVLGRNYCSPANFARRETACFDLATNRRQSNSIPTRELIERIGSLHVALLSRQLKNQVLFHAKFQHGTILMFNHPRAHRHTSKRAGRYSWWTKVGKFRSPYRSSQVIYAAKGSQVQILPLRFAPGQFAHDTRTSTRWHHCLDCLPGL